MRKTAIWVLAALLLASAAAVAAEFWEKKKYTQWTEKEVVKMLTNSPWVRSHIESEVHIDPLQRPALSAEVPQSETGAGAAPTGDSDVGLRAREQNPRLTYQFQIRSALPVRQALVRRAQLQQDYDRLPLEQRQTFDQKSERFLEEDFADRVVIFATFDSNIDFDKRECARYWQKQSTETLKGSVYLLGAKGRKAELQAFLLAGEIGQAFQFTFPRMLDGESLVGPGSKSLQLEFLHPGIRGKEGRRVLVEFKLKNMLLDGQLEY